MNLFMKTLFSMSLSGTVLTLLLLLGKRIWRDKISRQWQYYIWLFVVLRLLLPFGPEVNIMGKLYQTIGQTVNQAAYPAQKEAAVNDSNMLTNKVRIESRTGNTEKREEIFQCLLLFLEREGWLIWLMIALVLLMRKITAYQSFVRYVSAGAVPVSDLSYLDRLALAAKQAGFRKPVELWVNPLVSSPLLLGFAHPCIVLPEADYSEEAFSYIALHELIHGKRRDLLYKWLVQAAVCLHWFNPTVYLMSREITKACEFSCDEAVLTKAGYDNAQAYGNILLDAMAAVGKCKEYTGAVTLGENKRLLKERMVAIMNVKKGTKAVHALTGTLTIAVGVGALFLEGASFTAKASETEHDSFTAEVSETEGDSHIEDVSDGERLALSAEKFYEKGSLPLFQLAFSELGEEEQEAWLDRIYREGKIAFFSESVSMLDVDSPMIDRFAQKFYDDRDVSFFSVLAGRMSERTLETWLDRALDDREFGFQSMLYGQLGRDEEFDAMEEELERQQTEKYAAFGVTRKGKVDYYQGQMVKIFLDRRPDSSFYMLNINPEGEVNIKILRGTDGEIAGVAYMTEAEASELFGDEEEGIFQ